MTKYRNGSVIQLKNGKYRAFFSYNGKRISKTLATQNDALDWIAIQRTDVALGEFVEPTSITFGQWALECLRYKAQRAKPNTIEAYRAYAKYLAPLANIKLQTLNGIQLQRVVDAIPAPGMRAGVYRFIAVCINRALKINLLRKNILNQMEPPKYFPKEKEVFTRAEISRIYEVLEHHKYGAFFMFAFATGCRLGEILGLKIQSVHEDYVRIENIIALRADGTPKREASNRNITLPQNIIAMLRREWENNGAVLNSYVFSNQLGKPITNKTIYTAWEEILQTANVPFRNIHYIRHTHATMLLSDGVPIVEVQHRLGHQNASTTLNRYGHVLIDNRKKLLNTLDAMLPNMVV